MKILFKYLLLFLFSGNETGQSNCRHETGSLSGRYIMEDMTCAGFDFLNDSSAIFYNEAGCIGNELRLNYIDANRFLAIGNERINPECPPLVYVYKILNNNKNKLTLESYWTGWYTYPADTIILYKNN